MLMGRHQCQLLPALFLRHPDNFNCLLPRVCGDILVDQVFLRHAFVQDVRPDFLERITAVIPVNDISAENNLRNVSGQVQACRLFGPEEAVAFQQDRRVGFCQAVVPDNRHDNLSVSKHIFLPKN